MNRVDDESGGGVFVEMIKNGLYIAGFEQRDAVGMVGVAFESVNTGGDLGGVFFRADVSDGVFGVDSEGEGELG